MKFRLALVLALAMTMTLFTFFMTHADPSEGTVRSNRGIEFIFEDYPRYDWSQDPYEQDPKAILKRAIYREPYFIFQASRGEKASDHYLMALQVESGELYTIHQGFHRRFWLQDEVFRFQHVDRFFECPWGEWDSLRQIPDPTAQIGLEDRHITLKQEVPEILRAMDCEHIHTILEGSFTYPHYREILFITGRNQGYQLAVYRIEKAQMHLSAQLSIDKEFKALEPSRPQVHFREALALDMDGDGCLELIINGVYAAQDYLGDPLHLIDFSRSPSGEALQILPMPLQDDGKPYPNPRLVSRSPHQVELHLGISNPLRPSPMSVFQLHYPPGGEFQLQDPTVYTHPPLPPEEFPRHQEFISTRRLLATVPEASQPSLDRLPRVQLPPLYQLTDSLDFEERLYHQHRNNFVRSLVDRIQNDWNPFQDTPRYHSSLDDPQVLLDSWVQFQDVIPIRDSDRWLYVTSLVFHLRETCTWMFCLYDAQLRLLGLWCPHYYDVCPACPRLFPEAGKDFDPELLHVLLPLPGERTFLILYPGSFGPSKLQAVQVQTTGFQIRHQHTFRYLRYQPHHAGIKLELHQSYPMALPWSRDRVEKWVPCLRYIEPFSGEHVSRYFNANYRSRLDEAYYDLRFLYWQDFPTESFNPLHPRIVNLIEAYEEIVYYRAHTLLDTWDTGTFQTSH